MVNSESIAEGQLHSQDVLDRLFAEIARKMQAGEPVDVEAYVHDFPDQAEQIRQLLPAIRALADIGLSAVCDGSGASHQAKGEPISGLLGDFRILREIGRGGMGIVYEVEQVSLGRRMAIKVLPFAAVLNPKQLQRFKNEAQAAASLDHPNIVSVHSVGCERGIHYYAMQYVEGQTLAQVIDELRQPSGLVSKGEPESAEALSEPTRNLTSGRLTSSGEEHSGEESAADRAGEEGQPAGASGDSTGPRLQAAISTERSTNSPEFFRNVAHLGIQVAGALEHAHQMGVVHRDIKPSNLMVDAAGNSWITDFGLALTHTDVNLTMTGDRHAPLHEP